MLSVYILQIHSVEAFCDFADADSVFSQNLFSLANYLYINVIYFGDRALLKSHINKYLGPLFIHCIMLMLKSGCKYSTMLIAHNRFAFTFTHKLSVKYTICMFCM